MNKEYEIDDKIASKVKWSFAIGGLGKDMMFAMSTLMLGFFTIYVGVPVGIVGTIIMIARIWDAINDPIMGTIVDNTKSKFGKFRPWILIGTILNAIILIFVFFKPDLAPDSFWMIFYVSVFYILWGMSYTLMDIPFWSMIPTFSQSQKERESISVLTRIFTSIGYIIISAPWLIVVTLLGGGQTRTEILHGFFLLAIIVSIVFIITQLLVCKNAKEKYTTTNEEPTTLRKMISMLKSNDQLLVVMVTVLIFNFVLYTTSSMATFFFIFDINRDLTYDIKYLLFLFLAIGGVFQVASLFVYPLLSKFLKRRQIFQLSIIVSIVGFFGLFITAFFLKNNIYILFPIGVLVFFGLGLSTILQTVMLADTVEYGEWKFGRRSESITFSVQTFVVKLAMGLSAGVAGLGLTIFGFKGDRNVDSETFVYETQSMFTLWGIRSLMFILPIIGLLIALYIFRKYHILDEKKFSEVVHELRVRKGEENA